MVLEDMPSNKKGYIVERFVRRILNSSKLILTGLDTDKLNGLLKASAD